MNSLFYKFWSFCFFLSTSLFLVSQQQTLNGIVLTHNEKQPMPFVNLSVPGTTAGATTDMEGKFAITIPIGTQFLVFSFIGYLPDTVDIQNRSFIEVYMKEASQTLNEVVVTALGIKRDKKALGYGVQQVSGDELQVTRDASMINQLAGKVAGLSISATNAGAGSSSRIVLRGSNSFTGDNNALIVVDGVPMENTTISNAEGTWGGKDFGNGISDINPDDIESITVLKGASASALYGSRAANGVILITTKKGDKSQKGVRIQFTQNTTFDRAYIHYDLQNEFGAGRNGKFNPPFIINSDGIPVYNTNSASAFGSWGPRMEGQNIIDWDGNPAQYSPEPYNYRDFFRTGYSVTNAVSAEGNIKKTSIRLSVSDLRTQEIIDKSTFQRTNIGLNTDSKIGSILTISSYIAYAGQKVQNRFGLTDSKENPSRNYIMMPRNISNQSLQNFLIDSLGREQTWYMNWAWQGNPFYAAAYKYSGDERNRLFGNVSAVFTAGENLTAMFRTAPDVSVMDFEQRDPLGARTSSQGGYSESQTKQMLVNSDFLASYKNKITSDIRFSINAGGNAMVQHSEYYSAYTKGGLRIPGLYTIENSVDNPYLRQSPTHKKALNSLYGFGQIEYRDFLFLDVTGRNDWSSTLPKGNNSYFYPSVSLGFVFTDILGLKKHQEDVFSFGKIRASYAQVGNDTRPYQLHPTFFTDTISNVFGPIAYIANQVPPKNLKPEKIKSIELGTELKFFMNRISIDASVYKNNAVNQIVPADISHASGSTTALINAGNIENKGIEVQLTAIPIKTKNFEWEVNVNYTKNKSMVLELTDGLESLQLLEQWNLSIEARPGNPYGDIVGYAILRDAQGNKLVDENGMYLRNSTPQVLGNINPDFSMSLHNSLKYKNFGFSFLIDARIGGEMFAGTNMYGYGYSGNFSGTLEGRDAWYRSEREREEAGISADNWIATGGYQANGVYAPGTIINGQDVSGLPNTTFVNPERYWNQFSSWTNEIHEPFVYDASFVKLREISFSYQLPKSLVSRAKLQSATIAFYGRNVWLMYKNVPNIDPETSHTNGNGQGYELYSYPNKRSVGFSLNIMF